MYSKCVRNAAGAAVILAFVTGAAHAKGKTFALIQYN